MTTITIDRQQNPAAAPIRSRIDSRWHVDPLDADDMGDEVVVTSSRRLVRLAVAAAEVGSRFTRDGMSEDPAAWLLAPRNMFEGRTAIEACQELEGFERNLLLHGLGLGLDADGEALDQLVFDDADVDETFAGPVAELASVGCGHAPRRRLLTCWVDIKADGMITYAFCAVVTHDPADLVRRMVGRYGRAAATAATYLEGFDPSVPMAVAMIGDALADTLALAAAYPESAMAVGLDVLIEQRFAA